MTQSLDTDYRPTEDEPYMNPRQVEYFRRKLLAWRDELVRGSGLTLKQLQEDDARPADASDWASSEVQRAFELGLATASASCLPRSRRPSGGSTTAAMATARRPRSRSASSASTPGRSPRSASRRRSATSAASAATATTSALSR
jgi:hypothetical protein